MRKEAEKAAGMAVLQTASSVTSLRGIKLVPAIPENKPEQLTSLVQPVGSPPAKPTRASAEINSIQVTVVIARHVIETHNLPLGRRSQNEAPTCN